MRYLAGQVEKPGETGKWTEANLYKYMEAMAYSLAVKADEKNRNALDDIISVIGEVQGDDGYIHAHIMLNEERTGWGDLYMQHDGYVMGHMYQAAVAHYQVTGRKEFLNIACRSADEAYRHFIEEEAPGFPGHAEIEMALVELYRATGQKRYLELCRVFIERRGQDKTKECPYFPCKYFQDEVPISEQSEISGHAVRAVFFATGVADLALESSDAVMVNAARRLWENTTLRKMYITGSIGASHKHESFGDDYELPNDGYCESCAACGLADLAHRMLLLTRKGGCGDIMERVLYNAVLHGISLDGTSFYYRNPLSDKNHPRGNNWTCCPPNLLRTLMKIGSYAYLKSDREIYVNLYIGSKAGIELPDNRVILLQETKYPWQGKVKIIVKPAKRQAFSIKLRMPGWCREAGIKLNGSVINPALEDGYCCIKRAWQEGDRLEVDFAMPVERFEAHPNVKADTGRAAIQRGPVVYGLEGLDNKGDVDIVLPVEPGFKTKYVPGFLGGVTVIEGKSTEGKRFTAIPFYVMANREKSVQVVWLKQEGKKSALTGWSERLYRVLEADKLSR